MHVRGDEQVAIVIWITVQNNERIRSAMNDQVFAIVQASQPRAQEATPHRLRGRLDILSAPGSPDLIEHAPRLRAVAGKSHLIGARSRREPISIRRTRRDGSSPYSRPSAG